MYFRVPMGFPLCLNPVVPRTASVRRMRQERAQQQVEALEREVPDSTPMTLAEAQPWFRTLRQPADANKR